MAGSNEYLNLLDTIADNVRHDITQTPRLTDIDNAWNRLTTDTSEVNLQALAIACYAWTAQATHKSGGEVLTAAAQLHIRKNAGYAGFADNDPWANFRLAQAFGISPLDGVYVRMSDKYSRIRSLTRNPSNEQVGESIADTIVDLAAYALIAICLKREFLQLMERPRPEPEHGMGNNFYQRTIDGGEEPYRDLE